MNKKKILHFIYIVILVIYTTILIIEPIYSDYTNYLDTYGQGSINKKLKADKIGANKLFMYLSLLVFAISIYPIFRHRKKICNVSSIFFLIFILSYTLSYLFRLDETLIPNIGRTLRYIIFFWGIPSIFFSFSCDEKKLFIFSSFFIIGFSSIYFVMFRFSSVLLSLSQAGNRLNLGVFGATAIAKAYLGPLFLCFWASMSGMLKKNSRIVSIILMINGIGCFFVILASYSRGPIGIVFFLPILYLLLLRKKNAYLMILALVLIVMICLCIWHDLVVMSLYRYGSSDVLAGRGYKWIYAISMIKQDLGLLIGQGNLNEAPHNFFLGMITYHGLLSTFFWSFFFMYYALKFILLQYFYNKKDVKFNAATFSVILGILAYANIENFLFLNQSMLSYIFYFCMGYQVNFRIWDTNYHLKRVS